MSNRGSVHKRDRLRRRERSRLMFNQTPSMEYEYSKGRQRELERDLRRRRQLAEVPAARREPRPLLPTRLVRAVKATLGRALRRAPVQAPAVGRE